MRAVAARGRWIWGLAGLVAAVAVSVPGSRLLTGPYGSLAPRAEHAMPSAFSVSGLVTALSIQSYGARVRVRTGAVRSVQVRSVVASGLGQGQLPAVSQTLSGGLLTLDDPGCDEAACSVSFDVTVPRGIGVAVSTQGGAITVSGTAGAVLDSGGAPVTATGIDGPLVLTTEGGRALVTGLTGSLQADTGDAPLTARDVNAGSVTVITGGAPASIRLTSVPDSVLVSTDGGPARLTLPEGRYALLVYSGGAARRVGVPSDPASRRTIVVSTEGGAVWIGQAGR